MSVYIYKVNLEIWDLMPGSYSPSNHIWQEFTVNVEAVTALTAEELALYYVRQRHFKIIGRKSPKSNFRVRDALAFPETQDIDVDLYKVVPCG